MGMRGADPPASTDFVVLRSTVAAAAGASGAPVAPVDAGRVGVGGSAAGSPAVMGVAEVGAGAVPRAVARFAGAVFAGAVLFSLGLVFDVGLAAVGFFAVAVRPAVDFAGFSWAAFWAAVLCVGC